jgi:predicted transcriptional regulator
MAQAPEDQADRKTRATARNITVRLDAETLRRARMLAAREGSSVSRMLARAIADMVREDEAYEAAKRDALALLDRGFHWGGRIRATRDELHER